MIGHRYLRLVSRNYKSCLPVMQVHDQENLHYLTYAGLPGMLRLASNLGEGGAGPVPPQRNPHGISVTIEAA